MQAGQKIRVLELSTADSAHGSHCDGDRRETIFGWTVPSGGEAIASLKSLGKKEFYEKKGPTESKKGVTGSGK